MAKRTMVLTVNSRPDSNGILWAMLEDDHYSNACDWSGTLALHLQRRAQRLPGNSVRVDSGVFVGVDCSAVADDFISPLTFIVGVASEMFTGTAEGARFHHATHEHVNVGGEVGPVLYFHIDGES